ncbi:hypothetical protein Nepgr_003625, partial [Nepenthes gracilis]
SAVDLDQVSIKMNYQLQHGLTGIVSFEIFNCSSQWRVHEHVLLIFVKPCFSTLAASATSIDFAGNVVCPFDFRW